MRTGFAAIVLVLAGALETGAAAAEPQPGISNLKSEISDLKCSLCPVAPDVLALTVEAGRVENGRQVAYEPQPGDKIETHGAIGGWLIRDGKPLGRLVGKDARLLYTFDRIVGAPLDTAWADKAAGYALASEDDPSYGAGQRPAAVYRKTKPSDIGRTLDWKFEAPLVHVLYLKLPKPLAAGKKYRLTFAGGPLPELAFLYDPATQRTDAVHVSQIGFRPDDPVKIAYLSTWMGSGGGLSYAAGTPFHVVDEKTGRAVFDGRVALQLAASDTNEDAYKRSYNLTNIYAMDFSALDKPGAYRVVVDGVGGSTPFEVGPDVWRRAFLVSAKGLYHQRSGLAIGPPYTSYVRKRSFHPDDGVKIFASTCPLLDTGDGLNAKGTDHDNFGNLVKGKTDTLVPNAWGGYCDAGDWDRRIQHLDATRLLLELAAQFPAFTAGAALNIPETGKGLPDLVAEALWNVDFFRRLQGPDGSVRGGVESSEHPTFGEASWQESLTVMAYAPDLWSSYVYAGVAARAAGVLEALQAPDLATGYRQSALAAMRWAEADLPKHKGEKLPHEVRDARNLAAAELFRLTGDAEWNALFLDTTAFKGQEAELFVWQDHDQSDAAFVYARTSRPAVDPDVQKYCLMALIRAARTCVDLGQRSGFGYTRNSPYMPFIGLMGAPTATNLVRAHIVTGRPEYLRAAVLACQSGAGANPCNICFTTGVGASGPRHPLVVDARITGQAPPPGITVLGPLNLALNKDDWQVKLVAPYCYPPPLEWPTTEAYFDVFWFPMICEFTVHQTLGPNIYAWGYLAARK